MPNKSTYNLIGFALSFVFYVFIVLSLGFYLESRIKNNINYVISKNNVLDITLVQNKTKRNIVHKKITPQKKKEEKRASSVPSSKKMETQNTKKVALKGLFDKIDVKKVEEPKKQRAIESRKKSHDTKKPVEATIKKDDAKKLVESLNFEKQSNLSSTKNGVVDKFRGTVTQILDENWQNTIDTVSGNKALVSIYIDNLGKFSYKIEKLSYNDEFNSKLLDFLEQMKGKEFPPYTGGGVFTLQVEFKDIRNE